MKSVGVVLWAVGGSLLIVSACAACPPEAWMCASPMRQTNPNDLSRNLQTEPPTLFENNRFALQRDDSDPTHLQIRPVIKFGDDVRVSVRLGLHHGEAKVKWRW